MTPLAHDLARRGVAVWNVEYRGTGRDGGGWPETLPRRSPRRSITSRSWRRSTTARVVACGHSAGGHLALWSACRAIAARRIGARRRRGRPRARRSRSPGSATSARPHETGSATAPSRRSSTPSPTRSPDATRSPRPLALLPVSAAVLLVHGTDDVTSPCPRAEPSSRRPAAQAGGGPVELVELPDADHFDVIDPAHAAWAAVVRAASLAGRRRDTAERGTGSGARSRCSAPV